MGLWDYNEDFDVGFGTRMRARKTDQGPKVTISCMGKKFTGRSEAEAERKLNAYIREDNIRSLIRSGLSVPEIRNELSDADWEPDEEQIKLMKIAKAAEVASVKRFFGSDEEFCDESEGVKTFPMPVDQEEFQRLIQTKGEYTVMMSDGHFHQIRTHGNGMTFSYGGVVEEGVTNGKNSTARVRERLSRKPMAFAVPKTCLVCIDGSNVIGLDEQLRTRILESIVNALREAGYQFKVFVDKTIFSWLRNKKSDGVGADYLSNGEKEGFVIVAPNKTEADGQILQLAEFEENVHVISNDRYHDYAEMHPWLNDRGCGTRIHGVNLVPMAGGKVRVLIAGFNLDITV